MFRGPSAACLVRDGRILAAAREESFTGNLSDSGFPGQAIEYCLRAGKVGPAGVTVAAASGRPGDSGVRERISRWLRRKDPVRDLVARELDPRVPVHPVDAREAEAWAAFRPSPFEECAVLIAGGDLGFVVGRGDASGMRLLEKGDTAEDLFELARRAKEITGLDRLAVGGPAAGDRHAVGELHRGRIFERVWVQPASPGGAGAVGAAFSFLSALPSPPPRTSSSSTPPVFGPGYNAHQIRTFLRSRSVVPEEIARDEVATRVAGLLAEGRTVGWFVGRLDFGEETSATRSILERADSPLAAGRTLAVREERADEVLDLSAGPSPPLADALLTVPWRERTGRKTVPVAVVRRDDHRAFSDLLAAFEERTGEAALAARPLRREGRPVDATPQDAYDTFSLGDLHAILMGQYLVRNPNAA